MVTRKREKAGKYTLFWSGIFCAGSERERGEGRGQTEREKVSLALWCQVKEGQRDLPDSPGLLLVDISKVNLLNGDSPSKTHTHKQALGWLITGSGVCVCVCARICVIVRVCNQHQRQQTWVQVSRHYQVYTTKYTVHSIQYLVTTFKRLCLKTVCTSYSKPTICVLWLLTSCTQHWTNS